MYARTTARLLSAALLVAAAACGSDAATSPTPNASANLDRAFAELQIPALASYSGTAASAIAAITPSITDRSPCAYTPATQSFVCPTQSVSGLTVAASYSLLSATGAAQPAFDPATTNAVHTDARATGTVTSGATKLTVDAKQTLSLSGLLSERHVLDGTGTTAVNGVLAQSTGTTPVALTATTTIAQLVFPPSGSNARWPLSGTITSVSSTTIGAFPAIAARVVVTFNGTSSAGVDVSIAGVDSHCTIDLGTKATSCR